MRKLLTTLFLLVGSVAAQKVTTVPSTPHLTPEQAEVWKGEENYFRYLNEKDLAKSMSLWDDRFLGWPDYEKLPVNKVAIEAGVREELQKPDAAKYPLPKPEAVNVFGGVAVTFYFWPETDQSSPNVYRITHTWKKGPNGWRIIGGMSCEVPRSAKTQSSSPANSK